MTRKLCFHSYSEYFLQFSSYYFNMLWFKRHKLKLSLLLAWGSIVYIAPCLIGTVFGLPILYVRSKSPLDLCNPQLQKKWFLLNRNNFILVKCFRNSFRNTHSFNQFLRLFFWELPGSTSSNLTYIIITKLFPT